MDRKMPPLPNRKNNNTHRPTIEILSSKINIPARYNSVERVLRETKREFSSEAQGRPENAAENSVDYPRTNLLVRRPSSAQQNQSKQRVGLSKVSVRSRESKISVDSKQSRGSVQKARNRQSPHYNRKMRLSMPSISAHSWVLYEMKEEKFICGRANFKRREIASLTKIMNLITILELLSVHSLAANRIRVAVSKQACLMDGTTAELQPNMEISLQDLFYGMMLPSGNDAAYQIAQIGGTIAAMGMQCELQKSVAYSCQRLTKAILQNNNAVTVFNNEMNQAAKRISLNRSSWANPHGLSNVNNLSTAQDVAKLCLYCMKNNQFREIISTKEYSCQYYMQQIDDRGYKQIVKRWIRWQNTNKMLWEGWSGIKTGVTPNAGPCLAASYPIILKGRAYEFLIVLLCSETMQARWKEVKALISWISEDSCYA